MLSSPLGARDWSMALSHGNPDFVFLSNGSVTTGITSRSTPPPCEGDPTTPQCLPTDAAHTKVSPNGCLHRNGTVKSSFLPLDNQRVPQMLAQRCHPCPYHHPLSGRHSHPECHPEASPAVPSALASCCMQLPSEYSASLCANHLPVYQAACCPQPSPSFCLHHPWPDHFQHQQAPQHIAGLR